MARSARIVAPGHPHHVVQRGSRRQQVFFSDSDRRLYVQLLGLIAPRSGLQVWAYCLMDNHVHLVVVPEEAGDLAHGIGLLHSTYSRFVNARQGWRGHLWQARFSSFVLDEAHLVAAVRYVERNPVRAGIIERAEDYRWSSARAHVLGKRAERAGAAAEGPSSRIERAPGKSEHDGPSTGAAGGQLEGVVSDCYLTQAIPDWRAYLQEGDRPGDLARFRKHARTGWPAGSDEFVGDLERRLGRPVRALKPGPKPRRFSQLEPPC